MLCLCVPMNWLAVHHSQVQIDSEKFNFLSIIITFIEVRNNRERHAWGVATGAYLRNKTTQHNQLLDTSYVSTIHIASLLILKAAACS